MDDIFAIQLAESELRYLRSLLGLPGLDGDERTPTNSAASEKARRSAQESLAAKHYLRLPATTGGRVALDQAVAALLSVATFPQRGLVARVLREKSAEADELQVLESGQLLVEVRQGATGATKLTACRTAEVALRRLLDSAGLKKQPAAHQNAFRIAAVDLGQASRIIAGNGPEDGAAFLEERGVPAKAARRFAAALANPVRQCLLQAVVWEDGQPQELGRLTLIEEAYGLWLAGPIEENDGVLEVTPVAAATAAKRLRQLAQRVLSLEPA